MKSIKCTHCGLVNLETDNFCRRCASGLFSGSRSSRTYGYQRPKRGVSIFSIVLVGGVIVFFAWAYSSVQKEMKTIEATDAYRTASQSASERSGTTRSESDQERLDAYSGAVQNGQGLAESRKHLEETQKHMQPQAANAPKR